MFEEIAGLPAHPLLVHAPIILVPFLALAAIGYGVVPPWRRYFGWLVIALAIVAPVSVFFARESGEALEERLESRDALPAQLAEQVEQHSDLSTPLLWLTIGLAVASVVLVVVGHLAARARTAGVDGDGEGAPRGRAGMTVLSVVLAIAVIGLSVAAGWYLTQTGDSGARMVWDGS